MPAATAIRAEGLAKRYRSGPADLVIFENISFAVAPGEQVAIVGESGAGKSTLLHLLGGLDQPSQGRVLHDGADIYALPPEDLARFRNSRLGFVWQQNSLLPEFTADENVAMPLIISGMRRPDALAAARDRLAEVGLAARAHHRSGELSGGEQQRVALARALAADPPVLLADEPTGNLDHRTGEAIAALLKALHASRKLTSVIVTHNLEFARGADRVLRLEKGNMLDSAATASGTVSR